MNLVTLLDQVALAASIAPYFVFDSEPHLCSKPLVVLNTCDTSRM